MFVAKKSILFENTKGVFPKVMGKIPILPLFI